MCSSRFLREISNLNKIIMFINKKIVLYVLLFLLCTLVIMTVFDINQKIKIENALNIAEEYYYSGNLSNALERVQFVLSAKDKNLLAKGLLLNIANRYIELGDKYLAELKYNIAIYFYNESLAISYNENSTILRDKIIDESVIPKIFIRDLPLKSEVFINDVYESDSFSLVPKELELICDKSETIYYQGEPLCIKLFFPVQVREIKVKLLNSNGKSLSSSVAFIADTEQYHNTWYSFLGIPCTVIPGIYSLVFESIDSEDNIIRVSGNIKINKKDVPETIVYLEKKLTTLISKPDPVKTEERRYLRDLLYIINPDSFYHGLEFIHPIEGFPISSVFGEKHIFIYTDGTERSSSHRGIDYAAPEGTPVKAVADGRVVFARSRILSGNSIVIEHLPGVYSVYFHLSEININENDIISLGDIIGKVGNTGFSTGAHLHLAINIAGVYIDPDYFVINRPLVSWPVSFSFF